MGSKVRTHVATTALIPREAASPAGTRSPNWPKATTVAACVALSACAPAVLSHSGGTDSFGCHTDSRSGARHCHSQAGNGADDDGDPAVLAGILVGSAIVLGGTLALYWYLLSGSESSADGCCKICTAGKACGDTCISVSKACHVGPGCACNSSASFAGESRPTSSRAGPSAGTRRINSDARRPPRPRAVAVAAPLVVRSASEPEPTRDLARGLEVRLASRVDVVPMPAGRRQRIADCGYNARCACVAARATSASHLLWNQISVGEPQSLIRVTLIDLSTCRSEAHSKATAQTGGIEEAVHRASLRALESIQ